MAGDGSGEKWPQGCATLPITLLTIARVHAEQMPGTRAERRKLHGEGRATLLQSQVAVEPAITLQRTRLGHPWLPQQRRQQNPAPLLCKGELKRFGGEPCQRTTVRREIAQGCSDAQGLLCATLERLTRRDFASSHQQPLFVEKVRGTKGAALHAVVGRGETEPHQLQDHRFGQNRSPPWSPGQCSAREAATMPQETVLRGARHQVLLPSHVQRPRLQMARQLISSVGGVRSQVRE
mmetsp:Transcript_98312/g.154952  ORF Transcript_98312/g.154952 Transcript_98312/m.154952 type:complete len:236 (+) Transcript_98312:764-1471(+)